MECVVPDQKGYAFDVEAPVLPEVDEEESVGAHESEVHHVGEDTGWKRVEDALSWE